MKLIEGKTHSVFAAVLALFLVSCGSSEPPAEEVTADVAVEVEAAPVTELPLDGDTLVGRPTDSGAAISVRVFSDQELYIEYGAASGEYSGHTEVESLTANQIRTFEIDGLEPSSEIFYRARFKSGESEEFAAAPEFSFDTQKSEGSTFNFAIQADPHLGARTRFQKWCGPRCEREMTDDKIYEVTVANMLKLNPDFVMDLGDTFMTAQNVQNGLFAIQERVGGAPVGQEEVISDVTYLRDLFTPLGSTAPIMLVQGNHEAEDSARLNGTPDNLAVWAVNARKEYFPSPTDNGFYSGSTTEYEFIGRQDGYYSWEWGDALFIALDPFWTAAPQDPWSRTLGREQYDWLKQTLENSDATFKFVFLHHLIGGLDNPYGKSRAGALYSDYFEWGGRTPFDVEMWDPENYVPFEGGPETASDMQVEIRRVDPSTESYDFDEHRPGWGVPIQQMLLDNGVQIVFHGHDHIYAKEVHHSGLIYQEVPMPARGGQRPSREQLLLNAALTGYDIENGVIEEAPGFLNVTVSPEQVQVEYIRNIEGCEGDSCGEVVDSYTVPAL